MTDITKRNFVKRLLAASAVAPFTNISFAYGTPLEKRRYLAANQQNSSHYVSAFTHQGDILFSTKLPARAHDIIEHKNKHQAIVVARRPGYYLAVIDIHSGKIRHNIAPAEGRNFLGHALLSHDERWLYTTENDYENARGIISVRDTHHDYALVNEFDTGDIDPHELAFLSDNKTIVVANGGILTHPDTGRSKLNIDTMSPSLNYINSQNGDIIDSVKLPASLHKNSIRHLDVNKDDVVCFAMQYEGSLAEQPPLVGIHTLGKPVELLSASDNTQVRMRNYCGSVKYDLSGNVVAISSPRGNLITFWDAHKGQCITSIDVMDGCGIAVGEVANEFVITSGVGDIYRFNLDKQAKSTLTRDTNYQQHWDNHLLRI